MTDTNQKYRDTLLAGINEQLKERGLKPIPKLGDVTKGEIEIVGLKNIVDHGKRFFTDAIFSILHPKRDEKGKLKPGERAEGEYSVRFNANSAISDGAVFTVLVNGKFAIVKQWRVPLGRWTYEIPRGFSEKLDKAQITGKLGTVSIGDLPLQSVTRELGEEVMAEATVTSITHLGNVAQDTSYHSAAPSYFLVQIAVPPSLLETKLRGSDDEIASVQLWDVPTLRAELGQKICDSHTITGLSLVFNHIDKLPRLA